MAPMILPLLALSSFPLLQTPGTDVSTEGAELERLTQQQTEQPELDLLADLNRKIAEQQAERVRQRAEIEQQLAAKRKFEAELRKRAEVL